MFIWDTHHNVKSRPWVGHKSELDWLQPPSSDVLIAKDLSHVFPSKHTPLTLEKLISLHDQTKLVVTI